jgi:hypothetical protein
MGVAEPVAAQYSATLHDTSLADMHTVTDSHISSQSTILTKFGPLTDDTSWPKDNASTDVATRLDNTVGSNRD